MAKTHSQLTFFSRYMLCLLPLFFALGTSISWADNLRRIVEFRRETPAATQKQAVQASGSELVKFLPLINAAAIRLPSDRWQQALDYLRNHPDVKEIYTDSSMSIDSTANESGIEGNLIKPTASPQEPYPWNLLQIHLDHVGVSTEGEGVHVAVVDTGIDTSHPALSEVVIDGYNAVSGSVGDGAANGILASGEGGDGEGGDGEGGDGEGGDGEGGDAKGIAYMDCNGHGTHIAGIIAANTVGIAPRAQLYAVRVLDCYGQGLVSDLIDGLSWVYNQPQIKVVNTSLGYYRTNRDLYPLLHKVIKKLHEAGVVMVASGGNKRPDCILDGPDQGAKGLVAAGEGGDGEGGDGTGSVVKQPGCNTRVKFPARYAETIAVAASDINENIAYYSLRGPEIVLTAPGGTRQYPVTAPMTSVTRNSGNDASANSVVADGEGGDGEGGDGEGGDGEGGDGEGGDSEGAYGNGSGTSQAAAHVTGVVALLLSTDPTLTSYDVRTILQETAMPIDATMSAQGFGIVNAALAVQWVKERMARETTGTTSENKGTGIADDATVNKRALIGDGVSVGDDATIGWKVSIGDGSSVGDGAIISKKASIGDEVSIGGAAAISRKVLIGDGSSVGDGAIISKKVSIGDEVSIGDAASISKQVSIGDGASVGDGAKIYRNALIGDEVSVGDSTVIEKKTIIEEDVSIGEHVRVGKYAEVGRESQIMNGSNVRKEGVVGEQTTIGYDALISQDVTIGNNVAVGHGVQIHRYSEIGNTEDPNIYNTTIGDYTVIRSNVYIGINVNIGSFVVIGEGAIICDGTVIKDYAEIPAYAVVGCNN